MCLIPVYFVQSNTTTAELDQSFTLELAQSSSPVVTTRSAPLTNGNTARHNGDVPDLADDFKAHGSARPAQIGTL